MTIFNIFDPTYKELLQALKEKHNLSNEDIMELDKKLKESTEDLKQFINQNVGE